MGYRGKVGEQARARELRAEGLTLAEIAGALGVSMSSVSLWVRDVEFTPSPRRTGAQRRPHPAHEAKLRQIAEMDAEGVARLGVLSEEAFLVAGVALYAGEGSKTDGAVGFPNTDPRMVSFFCSWLRHFFDVEEARLRVRLYLHEDLDVEAAERFWSAVTAVPGTQFQRPYRAAADPTRRARRHEMGCATVTYSCSATHRRIMGLVRALLTCGFLPG
jgi:hypothetical protein